MVKVPFTTITFPLEGAIVGELVLVGDEVVGGGGRVGGGAQVSMRQGFVPLEIHSLSQDIGFPPTSLIKK